MMFAYRPSSGKDVYPERQRGNVSSRLEPHEHIIQQLYASEAPPSAAVSQIGGVHTTAKYSVC